VDALFLLKDSFQGFITLPWGLGPFVLNPVQVCGNFDVSVPELQACCVKDEIVQLDHVRLLDFSNNPSKSLGQYCDEEVEQHDLNQNRWKYENAPLREAQIVEVEIAKSEKINVSHS